MEKKDRRGEPVEAFKLSEGQKKFQVRFSRLQEARRMLQARTLQNQIENRSLRDLWEMLEGEFAGLPVPKNPTRGMEGMNFPDEEELMPQTGGQNR